MADDKNFTIDTDDTVMFKERKRLLFLGLPWTFTKYTITPSLLTIDRGLLSLQKMTVICTKFRM